MMNDADNMDESVFSGIEYDSAVVWSDDPEKAYFRAMIDDRRRQREEGGESEIEDSLIGDSTLADLMEDPLASFDPPQLTFTTSTGLSFGEEDTIERLRYAGEDQGYAIHNEPRNERSAPVQSQGWFAKRLSSSRRARPNPFTQTPTRNNSTHPPPPTDMGETGVVIPETIFVNPERSSAITTTSDPPHQPQKGRTPTVSTKQLSYRQTEEKRCTPRKILLFLAICVLIAIGVMSYMLSQYRFKKSQAAQAMNYDQPTPPPIFDFPDYEFTDSPTRSPVPISPATPPATTKTSFPTLPPAPLKGTSEPAVPSPTASPVDPVVVPAPDSILSLLVKFSPSSVVSLSNPSSPQRRAMEWLGQDPNFATFDDMQAIQRWVLSTFYLGSSGPQWSSSSGWQTEKPECTWSGVECNENGQVMNIDLADNNIVGPLPPELSLLSNSLTRLALDSNKISSSIPEEFGRLTNLGEY